MLMPSMLGIFSYIYHQNEPFILVNIPFVPRLGHGMNHQQKIRQNEVVLCWKMVFGIPPARLGLLPRADRYKWSDM